MPNSFLDSGFPLCRHNKTQTYGKFDSERTRQSSFGCRSVNDAEKLEESWRSGVRSWLQRVAPKRFARSRLPFMGSRIEQSSGLSWRAFVVRQNFSNCRRKVIDACTRHDNTVATTM